MKHKFLKFTGVLIAALALVGGGFWWGMEVGKKTPQNLIVQDVKNITGAPGASQVDFGTFWQAWQLINDEYLKNAKVDTNEKVRGAIRGMVAALGDPYTMFFDPQDGEKFQEDVQGNFGGVGIEIGIRKEHLTVIAPLKDSPADTAGIKAQDYILAINGSSTEGVNIEDAVSKIRGPIGTKVTLSIFRDDWDKPRDFSLQRAQIMVPTLDYQMKEGGIAYIQLYGFNANSEKLFAAAAAKAKSAGARGIVLDLRNNPGGYLDVAVDLAGYFVPKGKIVVSEESRNGIDVEMKAQGNELFLKTPTVILVNKGSASASEILAGAMRDLRGIKLIGQQSFGKGTVQQIKNLRDGSSIKVTVAHWVLPSGQILENGGLKPDIEVPLTDKDIENKKDPQLEKALEVVKQLKT